MNTKHRSGTGREPSAEPATPARDISRRKFLTGGAALAAVGIVAAPALDALPGQRATANPQQPRSSKMMIVCIIRYDIDPFQRDAFREYAENWGRIIPRCGGRLIGYFLPWQGTNYVGWGLIAFDDLAAYETYQKRLREDPEGRKNFAFAHTGRFILKEERNFVELVDGTFDIPAVRM